jgi:cell division protein FtsL
MVAKLKENKKRRRGRSLFLSVAVAVLFFSAVAFLIVNDLKVSRRRAELKAQISALKAEIEEAKKKKAELESQISQVGNRENIERVARDQLNLKKPGEEVVVVKKKERVGALEDKKENKSWWEKIKSIFWRD